MDKILEITNPMLSGVGFIFIIMGIIMYKFPPKKINGLYGYRTTSSMESQSKWDFAQKYSAKVMTFIGIGMFIFSFTRTLLPFDDDQNAIFGVAILLISVIILIVVVEKKLKQIK
ncbi:SdpI family protein [Flavobacterium sp. I3-2]|uniref:SdpI family protein n=1 Tax=Flavobacterium sp. I3-2 TaxID=2748319 RepID=UPI0015ADFF0A|nr:SdpI family protein [Flavobacterium sp. I3-2]